MATQSKCPEKQIEISGCLSVFLQTFIVVWKDGLAVITLEMHAEGKNEGIIIRSKTYI